MDHEKFRHLIRNSSDLPESLAFLKDDELSFEEVGDGNLNDVIRVARKRNPSKSVILKYAPPHIKILGPKYPLGTGRNYLEYRALSAFHNFCPGSVPRPFYCNKTENYAIIEDLKGYRDLRKELIDGVFDVQAALRIADYTLKLHKHSHKCHLPSEEFSKMIEDFRNTEMVDITDQFIFKRPWLQDDPTNKYSLDVQEHLYLVYGNEELLQNVKELQEKFLYQTECLLHGDLHTGSIMTSGGQAKIIDPEFAYVGPAAFDIGMLLANYVFSFYGHCYHPKEGALDFHKTVKTATLNTIKHYFDGMSSWMKEDQFTALVKETTGFAGCELLRRIIGTTRVPELEGRPRAEVTCMRLGLDLIIKHKQVKTVSAMVSSLEMDENKKSSF
ncbi:Methylthioribose kinase [Holothuria leucospilota]|uniref:Methylthioribose kinase n=1 Tax=Holothuria leucospilota TaxID=206669 RepID=A0A9Q1CAA5_HOLLE|nr:Methylthioribose kinase [Holothuria leucospilota]